MREDVFRVFRQDPDDRIVLHEGHRAVNLSLDEAFEVVRKLCQQGHKPEVIDLIRDTNDEREEDEPLEVQGKVIVRGELTPERALQLEQFLNGDVAISVMREFGVGLRIHLEQKTS